MSCTLPNPSSSGITLQNDSTTTYISRSVHDNPQQCQIFQMIPSYIQSTHHSIENQQQHHCPPTIVNMSCSNVIIKSRAHHTDKGHLQRLERRAPSTNPNPKPKTRNPPSITKAPVIPPTNTILPTQITRGIRINETVRFYTSPYPILTPSPSATPDTIKNNGSITPPTADTATSGQLPLPLPVLIGVAVGGFVLVVIVLVLLLILIRQRNRDKEDANKVYPDQHNSHGQGYSQIQNDLEKARAMYMEAERAKQQDAHHYGDQKEERYGGRTIRTDRPHLPRHLPRHDDKAFSMAQSVSSDGGSGTNSEHSGRSRQGRTQQRPMRSSSAGSGVGSAASLTIDTGVGRTRESDRRERQSPAPIGPDMYQYHKQQIQQRELEEHYRKQRELQQSRATSSPSSSSPPSMFSESGTLPSSNYSAQPLIHPTERVTSHSVQSVNASSLPPPPPPPPPGQPFVAGASDPSQRHRPYEHIPVPPVPMVPNAVFSPALSTTSSNRFQGYSGSERTASEAYIDLIPVDTANGSASPWMSPWATPALQPSSSRGKGKGKGKGKQKVQDAVGESPPVRDTLYDAYDYAFRDDAGANDGEIKYL